MLSKLGAQAPWWIEKRDVPVNPFAGMQVRGARPAALDATRVFTDGERNLLRTVTEGLESS